MHVVTYVCLGEQVPALTKCLALDMDGTLCTVANEITPSTLAALRSFANAGGLIVIATGRSGGRSTSNLPVPCCVHNDRFSERLRAVPVRGATSVIDRYRLRYTTCMFGFKAVHIPLRVVFY